MRKEDRPRPESRAPDIEVFTQSSLSLSWPGPHPDICLMLPQKILSNVNKTRHLRFPLKCPQIMPLHSLTRVTTSQLLKLLPLVCCGWNNFLCREYSYQPSALLQPEQGRNNHPCCDQSFLFLRVCWAAGSHGLFSVLLGI